MKKRIPNVVPSVVEDCRFLCRLQKWLVNMTFDNYEKKKNKILSSIFVRNQEAVKDLVHEMMCVPIIRPKSIQYLVLLTQELFNQIPSNPNFRKFKQNLLEEVYHPCKKYKYKVAQIHFLRQIYLVDLITLDDVIKQLETFPLLQENEYFMHFMYFAPELYKEKPEMYQKLLKIIYNFDRIPNSLREIRLNINKYEENGWDELIEYLNFEWPVNSIGYAIKQDNLGFIKSLLPHNEEEEEEDKLELAKNINYEELYPWTTTMPKNPFALHPLVQKDPTPLKIAGFYGATKFFTFLLEKAHLECDNDIQIQVVAGGKMQILRLCEKYSVDFEKSLPVASVFRHNHLFEWIYRFKDVRFDWVKKESFLQCVYYNSMDRALFFLEDGVDGLSRDDRWRTPLHIASELGHMAMLRLAGAVRGAEFSSGDSSGLTPLHLAAREGRLDVLRFLRVKGAEVNARDNAGWAPLHFAAQRGDEDCVAFLAGCRGADVNARSETDWTPAHAAAMEGRVGVLRLLRTLGADLFAKDAAGTTPLHAACARSNADAVRFLVDCGADVNARNSARKTPMALASDPRIIAMLEAAGGSPK